MSYLDTWPTGHADTEKSGKDLLPKWIKSEVDNSMIVFAEDFAKYLSVNSDGKNPLTTNQLRKFFSAVKLLQQQGYNKSEFIMLKPKLAYAAGRAQKTKMKDFQEVMTIAIDIVDKSEDKQKAFKNFISFFEAIVAYHKVYSKD